MKKLMFVAAVAAGFAVFGDGLESANTVGYATQSAGANGYPTLGAMFVTPGTTSFKLSNITAKNASYREDKIQYLDPALAKIDPNKVYTWYEDEEAPEDNGWYFYAPGTDNDEEYAEDEEFPAGTAFLGNFNPANGVELVYAGEVMKGDITIDTKDASGNYLPYMYIVNPLPKRIQLSEITAIGASYREDKIQTLDPAVAKIDASKVYTWYEDSEAPEDNGWYYYAPGTDNDEEYAGDEWIEIGGGFLCNFNVANEVKLVFAGVQ